MIIVNVGVLYFYLNLEYLIAKRELRIEFKGIRIRIIPFKDISSISKRRITWAENWRNTFRSRKRRLVIHRKRGLIKDLIITPENRYAFKHRLETAMKGLRDGNHPTGSGSDSD
ncbi:MAG TPA: hypothetical protein EYG38_08400 [Verrucomicrobia bacterium]|nr:hypothetical protein [Verrucomicrobiota bacterium]